MFPSIKDLIAKLPTFEDKSSGAAKFGQFMLGVLAYVVFTAVSIWLGGVI